MTEDLAERQMQFLFTLRSRGVTDARVLATLVHFFSNLVHSFAKKLDLPEDEQKR